MILNKICKKNNVNEKNISAFSPQSHSKRTLFLRLEQNEF